MIKHPLDFERPLIELEEQLDRLKIQIAGGDDAKRDEFAELERRTVKLRQDIYSRLKPYQRVQLSRHFDRPCSLDFIERMLTGFIELHGDRLFRDDPAIVGGPGRIADMPVMILGHQRGRTTQERLKRNFGMPQPEGYRKALRLFMLAEKFKLPLVTLIDTQGAYPGLEAEERGQAEAIARNLTVLSELTVPVISVVIGEGGSGGALALGVGDRLLMLENACYSVITPEGCASILWGHGRSAAPPAEEVGLAAEMLQLTAEDLKRNKVIDEIVSEPAGGAHRDYAEASENLKACILKHLSELGNLKVGDLLLKRYQKFRSIGPFTGGG